MKWSKAYAKIALAFLFLFHLTKRTFLFWRKQGGLGKFLSAYRADAIFPVSEEERARMASFQRCQVCSLCTLSCKAVSEGKAPHSFEPKFLLIGYGRSAHESEFFLEDWLPCFECSGCTVTCPNQVPVHAAAALIMERRERVGFRKP